MQNELEEKALEGVDGFFEKLTEYADVLGGKLTDIAPDAAEALLNLIQLKGGFILAIGFVAAAVTIFGLNQLRKVKIDKEGNFERLSDFFRLVGGVLFVCFGGSCAVSTLFDFYNWLAAFYPEGALAFKVLKAVGIEI